MPRPRAAALLVAVWLVGAVLATGTGLLAVRLVADQVGDEGVTTLSTLDADASPAPSRAASPTAVPPTAAAAPSAELEPETLSAPATFTTTGGVVGVQCRGAELVLLYATPAQGYSLDETEQEDGALRVRFRSRSDGDDGDDGESRVEISCASGAPVLLGDGGEDG